MKTNKRGGSKSRADTKPLKATSDTLQPSNTNRTNQGGQLSARLGPSNQAAKDFNFDQLAVEDYKGIEKETAKLKKK